LTAGVPDQAISLIRHAASHLDDMVFSIKAHFLCGVVVDAML